VRSDYDGDTIYGDYTVDEETGAVTALASYLPGVGQVDEATGAVYYYHADHLASVRVVTTCGVGAGDCVPGEAGTVVERIVHTAFGEPVTRLGIAPTPTRYLYAGAWGYESDFGADHAGGSPGDTALPYQHLGFRWYDPASGRFLQRDPIGIRGGLNVYGYVGNLPSQHVDADGLYTPSGPWGQTPGGIWVPEPFPSVPPTGGCRLSQFLFRLGRFSGPYILALCIPIAHQCATLLDSDTRRKQATLEAGQQVPMPNPWLPWNWGIYSDHPIVRFPVRTVSEWLW